MYDEANQPNAIYIFVTLKIDRCKTIYNLISSMEHILVSFCWYHGQVRYAPNEYDNNARNSGLASKVYNQQLRCYYHFTIYILNLYYHCTEILKRLHLSFYKTNMYFTMLDSPKLLNDRHLCKLIFVFLIFTFYIL